MFPDCITEVLLFALTTMCIYSKNTQNLIILCLLILCRCKGGGGKLKEKALMIMILLLIQSAYERRVYSFSSTLSSMQLLAHSLFFSHSLKEWSWGGWLHLGKATAAKLLPIPTSSRLNSAHAFSLKVYSPRNVRGDGLIGSFISPLAQFTKIIHSGVPVMWPIESHPSNSRNISYSYHGQNTIHTKSHRITTFLFNTNSVQKLDTWSTT